MKEVTTKPVVKNPMIFNQADLEQRQAQAREKFLSGHYITTSQGGYFSNPAANTESFNSFEGLLNYAEAQALAGNPRYPHILPIANPIFWQVSYYKPAEELAELLKEVDENVETEYKHEIEEFNQAQIDLLASQLYEQKKKKELKAEQDKEAKEKASALKEAQDYIASLLNQETI